MGFEKFVMKSVRTDEPMVSIHKDGIIGVNRACYLNYLSNYKLVTLFYDRERRIIGIKPTNTKKIGETYLVRTSRDGTIIKISAGAFLKYFNIDYTESKSFVARWNEEEGLVEVDLTQG